MAAILIVALLVAVITLGWLVLSQSKTIEKYEQELIKKARKNKNATK
jgi:signal transduction histidine kinase